LKPSQNELSNLIKTVNESFQKILKIKSSYIAYDESLFKFQPKKITKIKWEKKGDPVCIRYIPRKKTKNGKIKK
jgi:predicted small secreted protein